MNIKELIYTLGTNTNLRRFKSRCTNRINHYTDLLRKVDLFNEFVKLFKMGLIERHNKFILDERWLRDVLFDQ